MPLPIRKPPVKVLPPESREARSIRFTPREWAAIEADAQAVGVEPSSRARTLALMGLSVRRAAALAEAHRCHTVPCACGRVYAVTELA